MRVDISIDFDGASVDRGYRAEFLEQCNSTE